MPRLDHNKYVRRHLLLGILCREHDLAPCRLSRAEQQDLLTYFVPLRELDVAELKAHRSSVTNQARSLPQRAGRAWAKLQRLELEPVKPGRHKAHPVVSGAVVHAAPAYDKYVRALMHMAQDSRDFKT